jgi:hypothetical protein
MSHTRQITWWAVVIAVIVTARTSILAQTEASVQTVLSRSLSDTLCTYDRCALWLDVHGLVQGAEGRLLARHRWLRSLPLRRFVTGDSAVHYATRYEHERRRGATLSVLGGIVSGAGMVIAFAHDCGIGSDRCDIGNRAAAASITLMFGGIALDFIGLRSTTRAGQARARALWWHNRQFAR